MGPRKEQQRKCASTCHSKSPQRLALSGEPGNPSGSGDLRGARCIEGKAEATSELGWGGLGPQPQVQPRGSSSLDWLPGSGGSQTVKDGLCEPHLLPLVEQLAN